MPAHTRYIEVTGRWTADPLEVQNCEEGLRLQAVIRSCAEYLAVVKHADAADARAEVDRAYRAWYAHKHGVGTTPRCPICDAAWYAAQQRQVRGAPKRQRARKAAP